MGAQIAPLRRLVQTIADLVNWVRQLEPSFAFLLGLYFILPHWEVSAGEAQWQFQVIDTGPGIPADELPRLGQRFYRVDKARSGGGHGLGLAIAQSLIQAHGGELWLESEEGVGTRASFTLPIA